ncbi:hypothetical protein [Calothrix sp. 336/3]|uniref:hypothetical protein n=1 Tax=Calothrix sp. 336/3 TaxID=1337936 RepID=UPI0004E45314|nr:hypothetical protein [Calothrix sp. 336/3]AKG21786.1 hypothetical protein IJ00_11435 [Calothrix sp. 336/3]
MGRRKSVRELEKQLEYARNRAAYKAPDREDGTASQRRPKLSLAYKPMAIAAGEGAKKYRVQASKVSVEFFTQTALNLVDATAEDPLPRGAQPAKAHATVADASPEVIRAVGSKRPYIHYGKGTRGSKSQYSHTAPFSIQSVAAMDTEIKTLFNSVKSKLGGAYGRVWYSPEKFVITGSGE